MSDAETVLAAFLALAEAEPDVPVTIEKRLGRWQRHTRAELVRDIAALRAVLVADGIGSGTTVLLATADTTFWIVADLAAQAAGARVSAVSPAASAAELGRAIAVARADWVIAQDQHVVDRVLAAEREGHADGVRRLVYVERGNLGTYGDQRLVAVDALMERGRGLDPDGSALRTAVAGLAAADESVVALSSGITGAVRGAALSLRGLLAGTRAVIDALSLGPRDRLLAYRPLSDPSERTTTIYAGLLSGAVVALPESRATIQAAMYETAPTCVHLTPRFLDLVASDVRARLASARGLKGLVGRTWVRGVADRGRTRRTGPVGRLLVAFPVREKLGLDKARVVVVSGSELTPAVRGFYSALGLPVRTAFSITEAGGIVSLSAPGELDPGACGSPFSGVEVSRDERTGELLLRGPMVACPEDGWLRTGDRGGLEDGQLVLQGRLEEQLARDTGAPVALLPIESALRASPYIREAVVTREDDRTVVALELVESTVGRWAARHKLAFTTYRSLVALPEVQRFAQEEVDGILGETPLGSVDEIRLVRAPLETVPGALTPSEKLRRGPMLAAASAIDEGAAMPTPSSPAW